MAKPYVNSLETDVSRDQEGRGVGESCHDEERQSPEGRYVAAVG